MNKFRLPRKTKKQLRKGLWLYPRDDDENSLMARPYRSQEDYDAYKKGVLQNLGGKYNAKKRLITFRNKINKEVSVSDETLREYVNDLLAKEYRQRSFKILLKAKRSPKALKAYHKFVNACQLNKEDDSYGNVACMAIDSAEALLKTEYNPSKKKQVTSAI